MDNIEKLLRGCKELVNDIYSKYSSDKIELGIEKTLNDSQNNELQDYDGIENYFSNAYINTDCINSLKRIEVKKRIAEKIITFFESDCKKYNFKSFTALKSVKNNIPICRNFKVYNIYDEITINVISLEIFRYYENLIPSNSFANKLADDKASSYYKRYMPSYNAFSSNKYSLMKTYGFNRLLITDIVKYYDRINPNVLINILKKFMPYDEVAIESKYFETFFEFIEINCAEGLPQGPVFSHFLGALLLFDLPKLFNDKFPEFHIDIYVDDLNIFYYSNGDKDRSEEILCFLDSYLEKRLCKYEEVDSNSLIKYNFLSEEKTSYINLKEDNSKFIVLSQELSAINMLKSDFLNLEENDKESLKEALDNNLKELFELISNTEVQSEELVSAYKKQERFTKYRKLILTNNYNELLEMIKYLHNKDEVGLFDKSFSNYINAIKAQCISFELPTTEFKDILDNHILSKLFVFENHISFDNINEFYRKVCDFFLIEYERHINLRRDRKNSKPCYEYKIEDIYFALVECRKLFDDLINRNADNIYCNYDLNLEFFKASLQIQPIENEKRYCRISALSIQLRQIIEKLFFVKHFSTYRIALPYSEKNRILKLAEYRVIQFLLTSKDNFFDKLNYIISILEEHKADREYELVDPEILEVVKISIRSTCSGKFLDNIIEAHHFVRDIWKNGAQDMPFYTLHNQEHSVELIKILSRIDEKTNGKLFSRMSMIEKYALIMAVYVHDLGMLFFSSVDLMEGNDCKQSRKIEIDIQKVFNRVRKDGYNYTRGQILKSALDFHKEISHYRTEKTRSGHSYNSRRFSEEFKFITPELKHIVLEIANNHCQDVEKMFTQDIWYNMSKIDVRYISVLLRVADSLDQSINRVSNTLYTYFDKYVEEMDTVSIAHWAKHMLVKNISVEEVKEVTSNFRNEYNIIVQFNSLPFTKSFGKQSMRVYHDRHNNRLLYNKEGRKTMNLLDIFIDHFFGYVFSEIYHLNKYLNNEMNININVQYDDLKNDDKRFIRYEKSLAEYMLKLG